MWCSIRMVQTTFFFLLFLLTQHKCQEINADEYIIRPLNQSPVDSHCEVIRDNYILCDQSSMLLDAEHGPQQFSDSARKQYYVELEPNSRSLFRFSSAVPLEVVQVYYYIENVVQDNARARARLSFYSVEDSYLPRYPIPSTTTFIGTVSELVEVQFGTLCYELTVKTNVSNLLMTVNTALHLSEVNFFTSSMSEEGGCVEAYDSLPVLTSPAATSDAISTDTTETARPELTTMILPPPKITTEIEDAETLPVGTNEGLEGIDAQQPSSAVVIGVVVVVIAFVVIVVISVILIIIITLLLSKKQLPEQHSNVAVSSQPASSVLKMPDTNASVADTRLHKQI